MSNEMTKFFPSCVSCFSIFVCVCVVEGLSLANTLNQYMTPSISSPVHFHADIFWSIYCPESCVAVPWVCIRICGFKTQEIDINPTYKHIHSYTSWWIWKKRAGSWDWLKLGWRMDRWGALRKGWSKKSIVWGEYQKKKLWWMSKCKTLSNA